MGEARISKQALLRRRFRVKPLVVHQKTKGAPATVVELLITKTRLPEDRNLRKDTVWRRDWEMTRKLKITVKIDDKNFK